MFHLASPLKYHPFQDDGRGGFMPQTRLVFDGGADSLLGDSGAGRLGGTGFPYIGRVRLSGRTHAELKEAMETAYSKLLKVPVVAIRIRDPRVYGCLGCPGRPGGRGTGGR